MITPTQCGSTDFPCCYHCFLDAFGGTGGKDTVGMKADEDASFPVKIQGAGVESFELQVYLLLSLFSQRGFYTSLALLKMSFVNVLAPVCVSCSVG